MIHFAWIWILALLPLPLLIRWLLPPAKQSQQTALKVPFIHELTHLDVQIRPTATSRWPLLLATLAWICLVLAAARPQWQGDPIQLPVSGRDLMLAIDLSGSMEQTDFELNGQTVNRLQATKAIAGDFIQHRTGDRLGLILFGRQAYLQTPLTFDRQTVYTLLMESAIGLAGTETAIGDAIGLMVKRLEKSNHSEQVMILLTDGANTAGEVAPLKAAELAAQKGLKIYTIGIGADEMLVRSLFGSRRVNPSADLDETTLRGIAEKTGGKYFRARDVEELQKIYQIIDKLEPVEKEQHVFRPIKSLFIYPLSLALLFATILLLAQSPWVRKYG
ncbi:MAG: VWA domain-containing protein [Gammaproteobacteria bacterium]|nr:VWA domain-containing protein [Gammaproteobacteria bacterium]